MIDDDMLYICILSNKIDLNQAISVSHSVFTTKHFVLTNKNVFLITAEMLKQ